MTTTTTTTTTAAEEGCIQIIAYLKRNPKLTLPEFNTYWKTVHAAQVAPWAEKHNIRRYQQIYTTGKILPSSNALPSSTPSANLSIALEPVDFDGIAMFLAPSMQVLADAFKDPYFRDVIQPDERIFLDSEGTHGAIVATFTGEMLDVLSRGQSTLKECDGGNLIKYREAWVEYERAQR